MAPAGALRFGIVGGGRTRNGTGPFLAQHAEAAGAEVVGVVGRDAAGSARAADQLSERLGHAVVPHASVEGLVTHGLDALVIASPAPAHSVALRAAVVAGIPVLCEKPIVPVGAADELRGLLAGFRDRGLLLMEHCQWPEVLPAWRELFPGPSHPPRSITLRLAPAGTGRAMLEDSLSHLLSLVQALVPVDGTSELSELCFTGRAGGDDGLVTSFQLAVPFPSVACRLELFQCAEQPRPAWLAIDGRRMDREIDMADYQLRFRSRERTISVGDPSAALVYRFARYIREASHERTRIESDHIEHRARFYRRVVTDFDG